MRDVFWFLALGTILVTLPSQAQQSIPFEDVPAGIVFEGASPIRLNGDVAAMGEVSTTVGVRFPDGTLQESASGGGGSTVVQSLSANGGLYSNQIVDMIPPEAYTEICFKNGAVLVDIHSALETTAGGQCLPGDTGWILERLERNGGAVSFWTTARANCLRDGMRLPEPFEWQFACDNAGPHGFSAMTDDYEWASNMVHPQADNATFAASVRFGNGSCNVGSPGLVAHSNGTRDLYTYRCAR